MNFHLDKRLSKKKILLLSWRRLPEVYSAKHLNYEEEEEEEAGESEREKERERKEGQPPKKKPPSFPREIASHIDPCSLHLMDTEGGTAGGNWEIAMRVTRSH